jgi:hypothetical protein
MRNTLVIGLLVCLPTAVLLASAASALLVNKLRRAMNHRFHRPEMTREGTGRPLAAGPAREERRSDATQLSSAPTGRLYVVADETNTISLGRNRYAGHYLVLAADLRLSA